MKFIYLAVLFAIVLSAAALYQPKSEVASGPQYTPDGQLKFPERYRDWVFLTSGFDMSYRAAAQTGDSHQFDNVFVNPEAYRSFQQNGAWPDKTVLVLEGRRAEGKGSINQNGHFQGGVNAVEVHVKDESRFASKWAFFGFAENNTAPMIPLKAECYSCHAAHGAVDTTFVQFYPTLAGIAKTKGTFESR